MVKSTKPEMKRQATPAEVLAVIAGYFKQVKQTAIGHRVSDLLQHAQEVLSDTTITVAKLRQAVAGWVEEGVAYWYKGSKSLRVNKKKQHMVFAAIPAKVSFA